MTQSTAARQETLDALNGAKGLDDLYKVFDANHYTAGWHKKRRSLWPAPATEFKPLHWRYAEARTALDRAGEWIGTDLAERRNLLMFNPVGDNDYASTRTLVAAYQMIKPAEYARAHRHSPNALRLVLDAELGLFTVVDGIKLPMKAGDVLLTPGWCWHSHYNEGQHNAYWIDVLDVPLVHLLEPMFYEEFPGGYQPAQSEPSECPFWFPLDWAEAELAKSPADNNGVRRLVLPSQPHIPTMELSHLSLPRGASTGTDQTTANRIFAVVRGQGTSVIGDLRTEWKRGDVFVVPTWAPFKIAANEDALIFQANDEPTQRALGFFRGATQG